MEEDQGELEPGEVTEETCPRNPPVLVQLVQEDTKSQDQKGEKEVVAEDDNDVEALGRSFGSLDCPRAALLAWTSPNSLPSILLWPGVQ